MSLTSKDRALDRQVGGHHYKTMGIQPYQVSLPIVGSNAFLNIMKYLTRDKGDRMENLQKALHYIDMEKEEFPCGESWYTWVVKPLGYTTPESVNLIIQNFVLQFRNWKFYHHILTNFYYGKYKAARVQLEEFIEMKESKEI